MKIPDLEEGNVFVFNLQINIRILTFDLELIYIKIQRDTRNYLLSFEREIKNIILEIPTNVLPTMTHSVLDLTTLLLAAYVQSRPFLETLLNQRREKRTKSLNCKVCECETIFSKAVLKPLCLCYRNGLLHDINIKLSNILHDK